MKKINLLLFLLLSIAAIHAQTVTLQVLTGHSGNSINIPINTSSHSVTVYTTVNMPAPPSDSYPGTLKIYYKKDTTSPAIVANGGDSGGLLFLGGTTAVRQILFSLNSAQFYPEGGFIYAEYQTYSGLKYKSSNYPIKIISTPTDPGNGGGSNTCSLYEFVPYNGIPILPHHDPQYQEWYITPENFPYYVFIGPGQPVYSSARINLRDIGASYPSSCDFDIHVRPIFKSIGNVALTIDNTISSSQYITQGTSPQTINGNSATLSYVTGGRGNQVTNIIPLTHYQWQQRIVKTHEINWSGYKNYMATYGWKDIPGANGQNYTPPVTTGVVEYRRLIIENPEDSRFNWNTASSNVISVYTISNTNVGNSICCDQTITDMNNIPAANGTGPIYLTGDLLYQWQSSLDQQTWTNIYGANNYHYQPKSSGRGSGGRRNYPVYLRRIITDRSTDISYISNIVTYNYQIGSSKMNSDITINNLELKSETEIKIKELEITIYPNPTSSILTINQNNDSLPLIVKLFDLTGRQVINDKILNHDSTQIDISELPRGTYIITLENDNQKINKRVIKE
ncbi:T9SS type A sorting domain-containing protein [Flavobacterium cerinum]|uniref:T9SS type A sorting domain-containing protein n=1 Tax=Flavobacterium cerinum TaxID=2502784 RepID=A0ABY5IRK6_9FLAO|nr:T9SS type A sorting domain-containing protein [Flavobacterium cerinum]UUC45269.1 T9SS type A sorting domain-containing protein [Flavobacterium cerinum]